MMRRNTEPENARSYGNVSMLKARTSTRKMSAVFARTCEAVQVVCGFQDFWMIDGVSARVWDFLIDKSGGATCISSQVAYKVVAITLSMLAETLRPMSLIKFFGDCSGTQ
ncbi:hypothetical protein HGRIS_003699 [Hohenbuehelia grisea]|uniref:Uncharacterized protein n=1 Tax=Hohenbuehelia grisea TaxID=104357 RepID=A0ABR3JGD1_9AGAR